MGSVEGTEVKVKAGLRRHGITYQHVADEAERSWFMVWAVLNRRKKSQRILDIAKRLIAESKAKQAVGAA